MFNQWWVPIRGGASAVTVPGLFKIFKYSVAVQGASVNSFRCERFALKLALHMTARNVVIASECASVLRRTKFFTESEFLVGLYLSVRESRLMGDVPRCS